MADSQDCPGELATLWIPTQFSEELPWMNTPTLGCLVEKPSADQLDIQSREHISMPNRMFWRNREYYATLGHFLEFRIPNILEVYPAPSPHSHNAAVVWGPEALHKRKLAGSLAMNLLSVWQATWNALSCNNPKTGAHLDPAITETSTFISLNRVPHKLKAAFQSKDMMRYFT